VKQKPAGLIEAEGGSQVKRLTKVLFGLVAILGLSVGSISSVMAHYVYSSGIVYQNSDELICVHGRSETSHGGGGGYYRVDEQTHNCSGITVTRPAGNIAVRAKFYKWTGSEWVVCEDSDWSYNPTTSDHWGIAKDYGSSPPCGNGYYGTSGAAYIYWNDAWHGGWIWSGYHWLPA
jgi:hypothetical protein